MWCHLIITHIYLTANVPESYFHWIITLSPKPFFLLWVSVYVHTQTHMQAHPYTRYHFNHFKCNKKKSSPRETTWEMFPLIGTDFLTIQGMRVWSNWVKLKAKTQNNKQIYGKNKIIFWRCGTVLEGVQRSFWQRSVYSIPWDEHILHGCLYWSRLS